jgi:hypothetical protein
MCTNRVSPTTNSPTNVKNNTADPTIITQVMAAMVAGIRASHMGPTEWGDTTMRQSKDVKPYSPFQLAKLKGFCWVRTNRDIPLIWDYFRKTRDVNGDHTKLLEQMTNWARTHDVSITRDIFLDKVTIDEITKLEFNPQAATAYFSTTERGISILAVRPRHGNEMADIWSREQAMLLTEHSHTLSDALDLAKRISAHKWETI